MNVLSDACIQIYLKLYLCLSVNARITAIFYNLERCAVRQIRLKKNNESHERKLSNEIDSGREDCMKEEEKIVERADTDM